MKNEKIAALQDKMAANELDVYYLNSSDYHMSEYVPAYFRTIAYFSGFTGSVSTLVIDREKAYIFVDGRYHIQADEQCLPNDVEVIKLGTKGALEPEEFLLANYEGKTIGLDGKRASTAFVRGLIAKGLKVRSLDIYSDLIENRPPLAKDKLKEVPIEFSGKSRKEKLEELKYCFGRRCHIINNLESIAWLLNLRANDIVHTPVFMSFVILYKGDIYFFIDVERLKAETLDHLYEDGVIIRPYESYYDFLKSIKDTTIVFDELKVNFETYQRLRGRGNRIVGMTSIVEEMKAIKNDVEIANAIQANIHDGVAMVKFLKWLDKADKETLNEYEVADTLNEIRLGYKAFDLSFEPIVAYNSNAAMMHYSATEENNAQLHDQGILLIDSGGQYMEGTTDITRTISLGPVSDVIKKHFTIVLRSMFNLSEVKFMSGLCGKELDILARKDIWAQGIDYRCGTGHGVGHILSVHEAPPNIRYMSTPSRSEEYPLRPGHIVTDEPGVYLEGEYGIRCENMLLVEKDEENEYGQFLHFKTLTLCPFDLELIDEEELDPETRKTLNAYHKRVYDTLSPYLDEEENEFLRRLTREI